MKPQRKRIRNETVVISDENGEALDLASQESADIIASSDPWWLVGSTKYMVVLDAGDCPTGTLGTTCWADAKPIEYALYLIDFNGWVPSDGTLYVEAGDYSDTVVIDGSSGNGNLSTLKGLVRIRIRHHHTHRQHLHQQYHGRIHFKRLHHNRQRFTGK